MTDWHLDRGTWPSLMFSILLLTAGREAVGGEAVTNQRLATFHTFVSGKWALTQVDEASQGSEDLNGDGDRRDFVLHLIDLETAEVRNLALAGWDVSLSGDWGSFVVPESRQDLNGDGDTFDWVIHTYDFQRGATTNLAFAAGRFGTVVRGNWLLLDVGEAAQGGQDLNGDGDTEDDVFHLRALERGTTVVLPNAMRPIVLTEQWLVFAASESQPGAGDLNGDGDAQDLVVQVRDLESGATRNLGFATDSQLGGAVFEKWLSFTVDENAQGGRDLNGDGDDEDTVLHLLDLETGTTRNLGMASASSRFTGRWLLFGVPEAAQGGQDLNGDGDIRDNISYTYDLETGVIARIELDRFGLSVASGKWLVIAAEEDTPTELDLNGDGDADDDVLHLYDLETRTTVNLELALDHTSEPRLPAFRIFDRWALFAVSEADQAVGDLNGDGDATDGVIHVLDLETGRIQNLELAVLTFLSVSMEVKIFGRWLLVNVWEGQQGVQDLNGDGDTRDPVSHLYDLESGRTINLELAAFVDPVSGGSDTGYALHVNEPRQGGADLNGDGDGQDSVIHVLNSTALSELPLFVRGDCNGDGRVTGDVSDAVFLLQYSFGGGPEPPCVAACDTNGDGEVGGVTDAVYVLEYNFVGGPLPPAPYPECFGSRTLNDLRKDAALGCTMPLACE